MSRHQSMISDSSRQLIAGADRCVVALSGGLDSVVLLDLLTKLEPASLVAIHVDHQLFPESSAVAAFCVELTGRYSIPIDVVAVTVSSEGSLEARAREARYAVFGRLLKAGDLLLQAHHADDQVETILLDVFRGGRHHGLRGMPVSRKLGEAQLHRPLLDVTRSDIAQYATEHHLKWCEDPSNRDETIDRNYLRHSVLPLIKERFPGAAAALLQGAIRDERLQIQRLNEASASLQTNGGMPDNLALLDLRQWDAEAIKAKLDAWLIGLSLPLLTSGCSNELTQRVLAGSLIDITIGKLMFREHQSRLYVLRCLPENEAAALLSDALLSDALLSNALLSNALLLGEGALQLSGGILENSLVKGKGLPADIEYQVVNRRGGERLKQGVRRSLKNVFQEIGVPVWLRGRIPLIYVGDELVAVAGLSDWGIPMQIADDWQVPATVSGCVLQASFKDRIGSLETAES